MLRSLRRPRYLLAAAMVVALSAFGLVNANAAVTYYTYRNTATNTCLTTDVWTIIVAPCNGQDDQRFALVPVANGWSQLQPLIAPDVCAQLDVTGLTSPAAPLPPGSIIRAWCDTTETAQLFRSYQQSAELLRIRSYVNAQCLADRELLRARNQVTTSACVGVFNPLGSRWARS